MVHSLTHVPTYFELLKNKWVEIHFTKPYSWPIAAFYKPPPSDLIDRRRARYAPPLSPRCRPVQSLLDSWKSIFSHRQLKNRNEKQKCGSKHSDERSWSTVVDAAVLNFWILEKGKNTWQNYKAWDWSDGEERLKVYLTLAPQSHTIENVFWVCRGVTWHRQACSQSTLLFLWQQTNKRGYFGH